MGQNNISVSGGHDVEKWQQSEEVFIRPAVDIFETEQGLTLVADLPGVDKEDLKIDIDQGLLTVQANGKSHMKGDSIRREFLHGSFYRQFRLSDEIDSENIAAEMKNGVLTLLLPKSEEARPRRIEIRSA
jgi:HSP20 family molecular chaperone IbpA